MGAFGTDNPRPIIILPLLYSFLLGVFAYWTWRENLKPLWFYLYCGILLPAGIINFSGFAITSVIVAILLLEVARANRIQGWLSWGLLQFLGKISYSLYLNHVFIIGAAYFVGFKLLGRNIWSGIYLLNSRNFYQYCLCDINVAFGRKTFNQVGVKNIKIVNTNQAVEKLKLLITGASGFLGKYVVAEALQRGFSSSCG